MYIHKCVIYNLREEKGEYGMELISISAGILDHRFGILD